jgi:hypothetical protein
MSKAVVYTGADPEELEDGDHAGEWREDEEVTDVTIADGVTDIKQKAFDRCKGLTNLSFLKDSTVTTVDYYAFRDSSVAALWGMEGVRKLGDMVFYRCKDLRTIEGLGCEEMGDGWSSMCRRVEISFTSRRFSSRWSGTSTTKIHYQPSCMYR